MPCSTVREDWGEAGQVLAQLQTEEKLWEKPVK